MPLRFWSVRTPSRSYGYFTTLAETAEEAVAIVQARGHSKHDRAMRSHYNGKQTMLPDGTAVTNITYTTTADGNEHPGWALIQKAGGRGRFQQEVVRFLTEDEAQALIAANAG